jgi:hypothetical protein
MNSSNDFFEKFFGVILHGQTYLNALYVFLAFPLGLFYFIFLVTGLSLGVGLAILWVGFLILLAVFAGWYGLAAFERQMAIWLLHENIPPMLKQDLTGKITWQKFLAVLGSPVTWKGLAYLFVKFPLGILSFVVMVTAVSVSASLIAAPFYYRWFPPTVNFIVNGNAWNPGWVIDTLPEALALSLLGVVVVFISLHVINGLAWVSGKFARVMLGSFSPVPAAPAAPAVPSDPVATPQPTAPETPMQAS